MCCWEIMPKERSRAETIFDFTRLRAHSTLPTLWPVASGSQPTIYSRWVGIGLQKVRQHEERTHHHVHLGTAGPGPGWDLTPVFGSPCFSAPRTLVANSALPDKAHKMMRAMYPAGRSSLGRPTLDEYG